MKFVNIVEARDLMERQLKSWRERSYADLVTRIGQSEHFEVTGPSGVRYQLEIQAVWDSRTGGDVRVLGSIDDGGWRAFVPPTDSFIKAPDGSFVGEDAV